MMERTVNALLALFAAALICGVITVEGGEVLPTKRDTHDVETANAADTNQAASHFDLSPLLELMQGQNGADGRDGQDGRDGRDGLPGPPGPVGRDGVDGEKGQNGQPGIRGPLGAPGPRNGGAVYTRWGRTSCPTTPGTELVYAGRAGGTHYSTQGGAANFLCLPEDPDYIEFTAGVQGYSPVHGAEYEIDGGPLHAVHNHDIPCAVCFTSDRGTHIMLPAKTQCPHSWTLEYTGYLMSERYENYRKTFECIDKDPESIPGANANVNPARFSHTEASCIALPCPPYDPQKELTCAVCTK